MAYVISDGIVTGTFWEGKGLRFKEEFEKRDGTTGASYFTAFFQEPHGLNEGDRATFKGNLSVTLDEYEKDGEQKFSAKSTINNTRAEDVTYASESASAPVEDKVGF